jgi:5-formyltetrahydrofolate cyclo-ligase
MSDKQAARRRFLAARRALPADVRQADDRTLIVGAVALVQGSGTVAAYAPMPGEPGGAGLVTALAAAVETLLLPVLLPDLDLDWTPYEPGTPPGAGVRRDPAGPTLGVSAIAAAEVVLVPAVAVDSGGIRLGRGGGSYDRALARVRLETPVIALLYGPEVVDDLPREPHDRPVTAVLTPDGLRRLLPEGMNGRSGRKGTA